MNIYCFRSYNRVKSIVIKIHHKESYMCFTTWAYTVFGRHGVDRTRRHSQGVKGVGAPPLHIEDSITRDIQI